MADGKTMGQMNAEYGEWLDQQETVTRCALPGCVWEFSGTAAEARDQATEHRRNLHPELRPRSIAEIQRKKKQEDVKMKEESKQRAAREETWPKERIIKAFQDYAKKHGHPPRSTDASDPLLPSQTTVTKRFGSWSDGIEAAGFPRPGRGRAAGDVRLAAPRPRATVLKSRSPSADTSLEERLASHVENLLAEVRAEEQLASRRVRTAAAEIVRDALHSLTEEAA